MTDWPSPAALARYMAWSARRINERPSPTALRCQPRPTLTPTWSLKASRSDNEERTRSPTVRVMAEDVVDHLEMIEVDPQRADAPLADPKGVVQALLEYGAVGQSGERIVESPVGQLALQPLLLGQEVLELLVRGRDLRIGRFELSVSSFELACPLLDPRLSRRRLYRRPPVRSGSGNAAHCRRGPRGSGQGGGGPMPPAGSTGRPGCGAAAAPTRDRSGAGAAARRAPGRFGSERGPARRPAPRRTAGRAATGPSTAARTRRIEPAGEPAARPLPGRVGAR